jgi:hydroxylamine dehydrogenase
MKHLFILILSAAVVSVVQAVDCITCHQTETPGIVKDWQLSKHSKNNVDCSVCHGELHTSAADVDKVMLPLPETCADCHEQQVAQFKKGKHALAWSAMYAMPTIHWQPMELIEGIKGCGGCHKIGIKSGADLKELNKEGAGFGRASCDACHTRHLFSANEARQPEACQTCHMGFDHPQWEMYSSSKHGVRHALKATGRIPDDSAAPTCQTCHMQEGNHEVRTAWGFLAVRTNGLAPYPGESESWWKDRVTILQALGVLDPQGNPTGRLDLVKNADVARLSSEAFDLERTKMINTCGQCHSENFARAELNKADKTIADGDRLLAEAIKIVAGLYQEGLLKKPPEYKYDFPDLLTFHDAATPIEQRLFVMHLQHRMRLFQGAFHANPDYSLWYGWSEMVRDLAEIKEMAEYLRFRAKK